jgi:selenocysteine lyase/cysteine desulfurase
LALALQSRPVRLVAVSFVQFQTGLRMPLAEIAALCHRNGAELFVDGIQGVGCVPLDVRATGIDYLTCGSHKWLMGIEGAGFLYVRPERVAALRPVLAGWLSHENGVGFLFEGDGHLRYDRPIRRRADFLESGAMNTVGCAALEAAVDRLLELGIEAVFAHVQSYLDRLERELVARGFTSLRAAQPSGRSGILSVRPPEHLGLIEVWQQLGQAGITCTIPDGCLRFAPHWPNAPSELDTVLAVVDLLKS